jgi:hypothetical protein
MVPVTITTTASNGEDAGDEKVTIDHQTPHPTPIFALPTSRESNPLTIHGHIDDFPLNEIVVDTGSGVTAISLRAFNQLTPNRKAALQSPDPTIQVQAANNSQLTVKGVTLLNITLGGQARLRDIRALVLDNLGADCIVGNEHLKMFSHIDLRNQRLVFHDGEEVVSLQLSQGSSKSHLNTISLCRTMQIDPCSRSLLRTRDLKADENKGIKFDTGWAGAKAQSKRKRREMTTHIYRMRPYEERQRLQQRTGNTTH